MTLAIGHISEPVFEELEHLTDELREIAKRLSPREARYLVDNYYQVQEGRKRAASQTRSLGKFDESAILVSWMKEANTRLEKNIRHLLQGYAEAQEAGRWSISIVGIGPVIAAGLSAHIDIAKAPTVGHAWRFAGFDVPSNYHWVKPERGEKGMERPWNAKLKRLCWIIGDSFCKVHNKPNDIYGHIYAERKALEIARNEAGVFADQAATSLATRKIKDKELRDTYLAGKLPDGRIELRARRYATKLFLAHWHEVAHFSTYGSLPPKPYILSQPNHTHWLQAPNPDVVPGLREAQEVAMDAFLLAKGLPPK